MTRRNSHSMQQIVLDEHGVARFRENSIVSFLRETSAFDMNALALMNFSDDDREQFAQLIGYSVSWFGDLSYASPEVVRKADEKVDELLETTTKSQ